ncbi:hypothetical protein GOP47_0010121 [Adiantum capillus-veneris]|uniref:Uncharacterized protein n=1 Tax=Adiantum capillus-veneris TaxID=13818 RepID=A0A9D4UU53_ADICA|nr:hypothetical protein GOP47_0010121 [Adiantum capillus-veneris]
MLAIPSQALCYYKAGGALQSTAFRLCATAIRPRFHIARRLQDGYDGLARCQPFALGSFSSWLRSSLLAHRALFPAASTGSHDNVLFLADAAALLLYLMRSFCTDCRAVVEAIEVG